MELSKSEESEDPDGTRIQFVDTSDPNDESNFGSSWHMDLAIGLGVPSGSNLILLSLGIVGFILLNPFQKFLSFGFVSGSSLFPLFFERGCNFLVPLLLLALAFGHGGHFLLSLHDHKII